MSAIDFTVDYRKTASSLFACEKRDHPFLRLAKEVSFPNWDVMRGKHHRADENHRLENGAKISRLLPSGDVSHTATKPENEVNMRKSSRLDFSGQGYSDNETEDTLSKTRSDSLSTRRDSSSSRSITSSSTDDSPKPSRRVIKSADRNGNTQRYLEKSNSVGPFYATSSSRQLSKRRSIPIEVSKFNSGLRVFTEESTFTRLASAGTSNGGRALNRGTSVDEGENTALGKGSLDRNDSHLDIAELDSLQEEDSLDAADFRDLSLHRRNRPILTQQSSGGSADKESKNPSHYKGIRRGKYSPDYDPVRSVQKGKQFLRANSAFSLNDAKLYKRLRSRMLKSWEEDSHLQPQTGRQEKAEEYSRFNRFLQEKRQFLDELDSAVLEAQCAANYLPTIKDGRKISIVKSSSFQNIQDVQSETFEADFKKSITIPPKLKREQILKPHKLLQHLNLERHHHTDISTNSSDSDSSFRSSKSAALYHRSVSSESLASLRLNSHDPLGNVRLQHAQVTRAGSANAGVLSLPKNRRKSRLERIHSSFEGASEAYVANLARKYEHAKRRAARMNSASSADSDYSDAPRSGYGLHDAVKAGNIALAQRLVYDGADVNALDEFGMPPFHYALSGGRYDCVAFLLTAGANISEYFKGRRVKYFK